MQSHYCNYSVAPHAWHRLQTQRSASGLLSQSEYAFLKDFQLLRWWTLEVLEKQPNHYISLSDVQLLLQYFRSNLKYLLSVSLAKHSVLHSVNLLLQCSSNPGSLWKPKTEHFLHLYNLWFCDNLQNLSCLPLLYFPNFSILTLWLFFLFGCLWVPIW